MSGKIDRGFHLQPKCLQKSPISIKTGIKTQRNMTWDESRVFQQR